MIDLTLIIVSVLGAIPATIAAYASMENARNIKRGRAENQQLGADAKQERVDNQADNLAATAAVHTEVLTENGLTLGQTADALMTHQIEQTKKADRTMVENEHMGAMAETQDEDANKRSKESG